MGRRSVLLLALSAVFAQSGGTPKAPKGGDARPVVAGPGSSPAGAAGNPVRARVLVPTPGATDGAPSDSEPHSCACGKARPLVDGAWLDALNAGLDKDLRLLVGVLGGVELRPRLNARLAEFADLPVADRIVAKERLLRELLETAAD